MASPPEGSLLLRGTGPVATVYVMPRPGGRAGAAKVYPGPIDRATLAELADEQRILAGLRSVSSILLVEDVETLPDGRASLRMELCALSLAESVENNGPLPAGAVLSLARTIAAVLRDAHDAGIVHGGVTPANVLLRSAGQPVLADFGLGLRQRFPRPPEAAAAYTAPEVLRGAEPDERADLYGLGATLHWCLTGRSPFSARTGEPAGEVLLRALGEQPPTVTGDDVPPGLSALVSALLAKRPGDRPADAAAVLDHLDSSGRRPRRKRADAEFDDFGDDFAAPRRSSATWTPRPPAPAPARASTPRPARRFRGRRAASHDPEPPFFQSPPPRPPSQSTPPPTQQPASPPTPAPPSSAPLDPPETIVAQGNDGNPEVDGPGTPARPAQRHEADLFEDDFEDAGFDAAPAPAAPVAAPAPVAGIESGPEVVSVRVGTPRRGQEDHRPQAPWLLAAAAVIAVVGLFVVLGLGGGSDDASDRPGTTAPTAPPSATPSTPAVSAAPAVRLEIDELVDTGTSVRLTWRSTKPLTYAVFVAEQGRSTASARYRGSGTSLVVPVRPDLKYCFLIQGTDGSMTFESLPRAIRGATCKN